MLDLGFTLQERIAPGAGTRSKPMGGEIVGPREEPTTVTVAHRAACVHIPKIKYKTHPEMMGRWNG